MSTAEQLVVRQIDALRDAGCQRIFIDHGVTGVRMDRPELQAALASMRPGDVLTIASLDRLGRNVRGVLELVDDLERRGVGLRVLQLGLDTSTPSRRLVLTVLLLRRNSGVTTCPSAPATSLPPHDNAVGPADALAP